MQFQVWIIFYECFDSWCRPLTFGRSFDCGFNETVVFFSFCIRLWKKPLDHSFVLWFRLIVNIMTAQKLRGCLTWSLNFGAFESFKQEEDEMLWYLYFLVLHFLTILTLNARTSSEWNLPKKFCGNNWLHLGLGLSKTNLGYSYYIYNNSKSKKHKKRRDGRRIGKHLCNTKLSLRAKCIREQKDRDLN